ncbi:MAG: hypothetical protein C4576_31270 [Desulfobacteraceae bacterium]|nr:MAG: hypothetical protein C4576_31270 [Desulfobacteraceae bacterium]
MPNWDHGRKIDLALQELRSTEFVFILDDDAFLLSELILERGLSALNSDSRMAAYTFHSRDWWELPAAGGLHVPMGSYALLVRADTIHKEGLSFRTVRTSDPTIRNGSGYWDTGDYLQKELLERGYTIGYAPEEDRQDLPTFFGTSGGFLTFARRSFFRRRFVRRLNRSRSEKAVLKDNYSYQRACSATAVIDLFHGFFSGRPAFWDWFSEGELRTLAMGLPDRQARQEYSTTAERIFGIRDRLLTE